jgi:hypothetical protein
MPILRKVNRRSTDQTTRDYATRLASYRCLAPCWSPPVIREETLKEAVDRLLRETRERRLDARHREQRLGSKE